MRADAPRARRPRRGTFRLRGSTVRLRLTATYGGLFLASGTALLIVTYLLLRSAGILVLTDSDSSARVLRDIAEAPSAGIPAEDLRATVAHRLLERAAIALAVMTVLSAGLGWLAAGRALRPLRTITGAAREISATSLHQRLALTGHPDELRELGDTFDALLGRLEVAFDAQRRFVANASHELRTPLTRQRTLLEVALADPAPTVDSLRAACRRAVVAGHHLERLIEALLTLARSQRGLDHREPVDLADVAGDVLDSRGEDIRRQRLVVSADLGPATALGDARLVERLVTNLLDNALHHNHPGGSIRVATATRADHSALTIRNTGPLVPPADVDHLVQPFHRLGAHRAAAPERTGLGLSIVDAIARAHDASLRIHAPPTGGLDVEVRFPFAPVSTA